MSNLLANIAVMTKRHLRSLSRQPWYIAISLVQPVIWLLLFGALFRRVVDIPGFQAESYIDFLAPGVAMMSALFSSGWAGMGMLSDLDRNILDRFLVSPAHRSSLIIGRIIQQAVTTGLQSLIILLLAKALGAKLSTGILGMSAVVIAAMLLASGIACLSHALALKMRSREPLIGAMQFIATPATFLSSAYMQTNLMPHWMQNIAHYNPVHWAVEAGRAALHSPLDTTLILSRMGFLALFTLGCGILAVLAFRGYQKSL